MPHSFEGKHRKKLPAEYDRRRKVSEQQKQDIRELHRKGESIRAIARRYEGIYSRRAIQFLLFPERAKVNAQHYKDRGQGRKSYERVKGERWAQIMREHRRYKRAVLKNL